MKFKGKGLPGGGPLTFGQLVWGDTEINGELFEPRRMQRVEHWIGWLMTQLPASDMPEISTGPVS
jgi:hypothetical protein